jgi:hypothetical protein
VPYWRVRSETSNDRKIDKILKCFECSILMSTSSKFLKEVEVLKVSRTLHITHYTILWTVGLALCSLCSHWIAANSELMLGSVAGNLLSANPYFMMPTHHSGGYGVHQLFIIMLLLSCWKSSQSVEDSQERVVVAFGSCNRQNKPQVHWDFIKTTSPDLFIWTGDKIN